jgi:hypothetical protein
MVEKTFWFLRYLLFSNYIFGIESISKYISRIFIFTVSLAHPISFGFLQAMIIVGVYKISDELLGILVPIMRRIRTF